MPQKGSLYSVFLPRNDLTKDYAKSSIHQFLKISCHENYIKMPKKNYDMTNIIMGVGSPKT